ncbi:MAG: AAA family ATPase, partial [Deltaproteobacteria bacterium]|nr:AAA family ATPase [Deltaproteobacteria bacterium]
MEDELFMRIATVTYPFKKIREDDYLYLDKTPYIEKLINHNDNLFFLQRPRRFGKSLLISTMLSLFKGESELFVGLALNGSNYDFTEYPVINFDLSDLAWESRLLLKTDLNEWVCQK